jgi:hypothetical protein
MQKQGSQGKTRVFWGEKGTCYKDEEVLRVIVAWCVGFGPGEVVLLGCPAHESKDLAARLLFEAFRGVNKQPAQCSFFAARSSELPVLCFRTSKIQGPRQEEAFVPHRQALCLALALAPSHLILHPPVSPV